MTRSITTSIFAIVLVLAGSFAASSQTLPEGKWKLTSYSFKQKIAYPIDSLNVTMNVKDGRLGGRSGCNVYGGSFTIDEGKLKVGPVVSTMMACEEPAMSFERSYLGVLQAATEFTVEEETMTITDPVTFSFLRFARVREDSNTNEDRN